MVFSEEVHDLLHHRHDCFEEEGPKASAKAYCSCLRGAFKLIQI